MFWRQLAAFVLVIIYLAVPAKSADIPSSVIYNAELKGRDFSGQTASS